MHKKSFHNCSMTIFNYLKIVHDLKQKSMNNWLLFYMRLFLLILGSYSCYWTVFSWKIQQQKKRKYKHVYSVGTYSLETLFCLGPAQSCGGTEDQSLSDDLSANYSAYSHGPLTDVAPKRRTVINFSWISWCKISLVCCLQNTRNSILWKYINVGTV